MSFQPPTYKVKYKSEKLKMMLESKRALILKIQLVEHFFINFSTRITQSSLLLKINSYFCILKFTDDFF
jgi:hypothetical protein